MSPTTQDTGGKPSIVLSYGAFHTPYHYNLYLEALQKTTKFDRVIIPQQTAASTAPPSDCFDIDVASINTAITTELKSGRDVLLVVHSYGSIPACEALANIPKSPSENEGKPVGRILGIVFVAAYVLELGQSLMTSYDKYGDWITYVDGVCYAARGESVFYGSLTSQSVVKDLVERVVPHSGASFAAETKYDIWRDFPCYYLRCTEDQALKLEQQDFFIERLRRLARKAAVVRDLPSDHSPFACMPEKLAEVTEGIVAELRSGNNAAA